MRKSNSFWYLLGIGLTLAPVSARVLTWPTTQPLHFTEAEAQAGQELFTRQWRANDPLCPDGDGLGPVFNANSCVQCHFQGGLGGSGGLEHNVTTFANRKRQGVVHSSAIAEEFQETLAHVSFDLPALSSPVAIRPLVDTLPSHHEVSLGQRNTPSLFGAELIDQIPDQVILAREREQRLRWNLAPSTTTNAPVGRALLLAERKVGKFGWKAQSTTLLSFVQAACANELGLGNPGNEQPRPLGKVDYKAKGHDLTLEQCRHMTMFIASLPRPAEVVPSLPSARDHAHRGKKLFENIGCAECHTPNLGSVEGIYSDLLLHRMGLDLEGSNSSYNPPPPPSMPNPDDGPLPDEWRTPPLWGVADSAPYLHDGRAKTLDEAIRLHGGQAARSVATFLHVLNVAERNTLLTFLGTLRAPQAKQ